MPPTNSNESYCTFTLASDVTAGGLPSEEEIAKDLESPDNNVKKHALKAAIMAMLGGEHMPRILMQVIRFCINSSDKQLKKLCMLYWEIVPRYQELTGQEIAAQAAGQVVKRKMLPEMILVCNALMNDLNHPNEYVRGSMLRFLCKVKDEEILGPLIPSIKTCLTHRHSYVRKNAALAVLHVYKHYGETLLPDAPDLMGEFLAVETDMAARRNAFSMMISESEDLAFQFLAQNVDAVVSDYGDGFQLLVLELCRKVCRRDPTQKSRFVRVLFALLSSDSAAVSYEAAWTLVSLSSAPTAVRAAAVTYTNLLNGQTDPNVQLIVLERLESLKVKHAKILQELLMDILRAVTSPNPDICEKVLKIAMESIHSRNVSDVVNVLKRELLKTMDESDSSDERAPIVRNLLVKSIHNCAVRFPHVAESVVHTLLDLLSTEGTAIQVALFVRAIMEQYPQLRSALLPKLMSSLNDITSNPVMCICLWIVGEYSEDTASLTQGFEALVEECGELPFVVKKKDESEKSTAAADEPKLVTKNVVLSDGTYATQTVYSSAKTATVTDSTPPLRKMILAGDVFLGETLSVALTKLCLKAAQDGGSDASDWKAKTCQAVLIMCGIVKMAEATNNAQRSALSDCVDRLTLCTRALLDSKAKDLVQAVFLEQGKVQFARYLQMIQEKQQELSADKKTESKSTVTSQADDLIHFRQLRTFAVQGGDVDLDDGADLARATGYDNAGSLLSSELSHVYQMSGFADPVYAEALVTVHDYDIVLEIMVLNRTSSTLKNLTVELSTMGDMKIVERPQSQTIGPNDQMTTRASIKVSSTETGHIFGTIVYTDMTTNERHYVNLNDIHMDIMDYIRPATCTDELFRSMWAEFEWENKVAINTSIPDLVDFLNHIVKSTNMKCLTPHDPSEKGSFLAANLYAKSVFGEDALVNVSVEKKDDNDGKLGGYIRIRSKTQGIALSLGDRITAVQRSGTTA